MKQSLSLIFSAYQEEADVWTSELLPWKRTATYVRILLNDHVKHRHSHTVLMKVCDVTDTDAPQGGSILIQTTQTLEESYCKKYGMLWKKENKKLLCNIFPAVSGIKSGWQESVYTPFGQLSTGAAHIHQASFTLSHCTA